MLSIIVPVYNVAQYLRHCLQSLTEQGLGNDYEVLLINDASRDNSMGICSEWCQDHPHFRLINHSENRGLSEARNTGLREAKGEWVTFVDSDDFLYPDTLRQLMLLTTEEVDVIEYPVMERYLGQHPNHLTFQPADITFKQWLSQGGHKHCYACNKLFRRSLWQHTQFLPGRYFEDIFTIPDILRQARLIRQSNQGLYYYCERSGSICTAYTARSYRDFVEAHAHLLDMPESEGNYDLYLRAFNGELTYRRLSGETSWIIRHRRIPLRFALQKGLSFHDRLKILWKAFTIHG